MCVCVLRSKSLSKYSSINLWRNISATARAATVVTKRNWTTDAPISRQLSLANFVCVKFFVYRAAVPLSRNCSATFGFLNRLELDKRKSLLQMKPFTRTLSQGVHFLPFARRAWREQLVSALRANLSPVRPNQLLLALNDGPWQTPTPTTTTVRKRRRLECAHHWRLGLQRAGDLTFPASSQPS